MSEASEKSIPSTDIEALIQYTNKTANEIDADPTLSARQEYWQGILVQLDEATNSGQLTREQQRSLLATLLTGTEAESDIDSLTKIYNQRGLKRRFGEEVSRFKREIHQGKNPPAISVCLLDIDGFKEYNDKNGHPAGDKLLINIAATLGVLRGEDIFGRYGGDEFMIIFPDTEGENAMLAIGRAQAEMHKRSFPITCSAGVVQIDSEYQWDKLYSRADDALYQAKEKGGNRVVLWEKGMPEKMPEKIP